MGNYKVFKVKEGEVDCDGNRWNAFQGRYFTTDETKLQDANVIGAFRGGIVQPQWLVNASNVLGGPRWGTMTNAIGDTYSVDDLDSSDDEE